MDFSYNYFIVHDHILLVRKLNLKCVKVPNRNHHHPPKTHFGIFNSPHQNKKSKGTEKCAYQILVSA